MKVSRAFETLENINPARHSNTETTRILTAGCVFSAIFLYTKAQKLHQTAGCEVRTPEMTTVHVFSDTTRSRVVSVRKVTAVSEVAVFVLRTVHEDGGTNHLLICMTLCPERLESYIKIT
jgi:hypothetical protein